MLLSDVDSVNSDADVVKWKVMASLHMLHHHHHEEQKTSPVGWTIVKYSTNTLRLERRIISKISYI